MLRDHIIVGINRFEKQDDTHEKVRRIDTVTLRPINAQLKLNGYETKEAHECGQRFHFFTSSKILSVLGLLGATIWHICMPIINNSNLRTNQALIHDTSSITEWGAFTFSILFLITSG